MDNLDMVKRTEAAHVNALEDFPLFLGSLVRILPPTILGLQQIGELTDIS
jgi:hypothetical protein